MPSTNQEKINPLKDPSLADSLRQAYERKTVRNRAAAQAIFSSGEIKPFVGYNETDSGEIFNIVLVLDKKSSTMVVERVAEPLSEIAKKYNLSAIFAGKDDQPPHITLYMSRFMNVPTDIQKIALEWLQSDKSHIDWLTQALHGAKFLMSNLVVGPNSYISANFDESQAISFRARKLIERIMVRALKNTGYTEDELKQPYSYDDIFHCSIARLTATADPTDLLNFSREAEQTIAQNLQEYPIEVVVASVFNGTALEFRSNSPHLIKR